MLWYKKEATSFTQAFPIGNGSVGAMVYGGTKKEKISFNHDSFWSGIPYSENDVGVNEAFNEAKELLKKGEFVKTQKLLDDKMIYTPTATYLAGINLFIDFSCEGGISEYKRVLDLNTAVVSIDYKIGELNIKREVFASNKHGVVAVKICSDKELSFELSSDSIHPLNVTCENNLLLAQARAPVAVASFFECIDSSANVYDEEDKNRSSLLFLNARIETNGAVKSKDNKINVSFASETVLYIKVACSFEDYNTMPLQKINDRISKELSFYNLSDYKTVKKEHINDYKSLFDKSFFSLGEDEFKEYPTDERLARQTGLYDDNTLMVMLWKYAKYLTIACSRKGSKMSNLQGVWSEEERPPWSSAYTVNINIQMNYWLCETLNLGECHFPLFDFIINLYENGKKTAKRFYNCSGWCSHHKTDIWAHSKPTGARAIHGFWQMSGIWLCAHILEHYLHSNDQNFLKEYFYLIEEAVSFVLDWLEVDEDGNLHSLLSSSPENSFLVDGNKVSVHYDSAMDIALIKGLLEMCVLGENLLGLSDLTHKINNISDKLPNFKIGSKGQLLEWGEELVEADPTHRHISLLYGLYPGNSIKSEDTKLINACTKTMLLRGNKSTGWGTAWRISVWARLKNPEMAFDSLTNMLDFIDLNSAEKNNNGLYENLFNGQPFQVDGNFGYAAGVNEMLLQSHEDKMDILPAIPKQWKIGEFHGFVARGGHVVSCKWSDNKAEVVILFAKSGTCKINCFKEEKTYTAKNNEKITFVFSKLA